jgi:hypothetical protein
MLPLFWATNFLHKALKSSQNGKILSNLGALL